MKKAKEIEKENKIARPPVVVVMGHVDHGKTTLLDYIRKTNLATREAGAITQSIGAYEITHGDRKITFIDTPGHEAFSKMRGRGAKAADIAILVVAADEGVKPQTKESIEQIRATNTPFIVAFTKIDKPNADTQRARTQLSELGVVVESWGGDIPEQEVSAVSGAGIDELLDLVLLATDLQELKADKNAQGRGVIIETKRDSKRGIITSLIILDGTLREGEYVRTPTAKGKIKLLEDFKGTRTMEATFSSPVLVIGFETSPLVGEEWVGGSEEAVAQPILDEKEAVESTERINKKTPEGIKAINVIIKADTYGSYEALDAIIQSITRERLLIHVLDSGVGDITDSDLKLANTFDATILGFHVKMASSLRLLVDQLKIRVIASDVIYETVKLFEEFLDKQLANDKEYLGEFEILKLFSVSKKGQLVGGKILIGNLAVNKRVDIFREHIKLGEGRVINLRSGKQEVKTMPQNKECGALVQSGASIEVGDILKSFQG
ncbi:MAG: translation initiation factor IF-2 [Parcubacteria group bacterium]|nr:translation initiation factor IF-2 [Parcubacteria group bacterium]